MTTIASAPQKILVAVNDVTAELKYEKVMNAKRVKIELWAVDKMTNTITYANLALPLRRKKQNKTRQNTAETCVVI